MIRERKPGHPPTEDRTTMVLRPMRPADVARIAEIDRQTFGPGAWPARAFRQELQTNKLARYFVIEAGSGAPLLGYIGLWTVIDEVHVVTIAVDPAFQRQGLGEALILRALDLAAEVGAERVTLECRPSNGAALRLYGKYEFVEAGRRPRYYPDNQEDAVILTVYEVSGPGFRARLEERRAAHRRRYRLRVREESAPAPL